MKHLKKYENFVEIQDAVTNLNKQDFDNFSFVHFIKYSFVPSDHTS